MTIDSQFSWQPTVQVYRPVLTLSAWQGVENAVAKLTSRNASTNACNVVNNVFNFVPKFNLMRSQKQKQPDILGHSLLIFT